MRTGGHVVAECLGALGAGAVFGVPGVHSLAIWEGLRTSSVPTVGMRTELCAGFAADGYARSTGRPAPLLLSTGPGALNSLTALMEAASAYVPVVAISSQVPRDLVGRGRGYLHELPDQLASFAPIVKHAVRIDNADAIPDQLAEAWAVALTPPCGPVYAEIPVDVLTGAAQASPVTELPVQVASHRARPDAVDAAARLLVDAVRPVIWAGGGVVRSGACSELTALAERLGAPVATTYMGKGALPDDHPLAVGAGCDEAAFQELVSGADVVLCVGTELGAETTGQYALEFSGRVVHLDAAPDRIGVSYPALPLVGDAKLTLADLLERVPSQPRSDGPSRVTRVRERIARGLETQGHATETAMLAAVERVLPADAVSAWDMTILGYWAAPHLRLRDRQRFLYPLGSGTLGYAWPAALGAGVADPGRPVFAVVGDGGLQYALAELATARQYGVNATLLVVDDGGYGILREYQRDAFGATVSVDLVQPDFAALAEAFGVPVRSGAPGSLADDLAWAFSIEGPAVVVVEATLRSAEPTA